MIHNVRIMINADVNAKNWLTIRCDDEFIWNPSICKCECDAEEYLDYTNYKCRKRLIYKLVEESSEDINGNDL